MVTRVSGDTGVDSVKPYSVDLEDLKWTPPFTKEYISPEQTITLGGTVNLPHGLGVVPKLTQLVLVCKTTDLGCTVGEEINLYRDANNSSSGADMFRNATTLRIVVGTTAPNVFNTVGALLAITPANWRIVARAWA
jgi:hypothetical protein